MNEKPINSMTREELFREASLATALGRNVHEWIGAMMERAYELGMNSVASGADTKDHDLYTFGTAFEVRMPSGKSRWIHPERVNVHSRLS